MIIHIVDAWASEFIKDIESEKWYVTTSNHTFILLPIFSTI